MRKKHSRMSLVIDDVNPCSNRPKERGEQIFFLIGRTLLAMDRIVTHKPNRGLQDWKSMEDQEGERGGVFEVSVKL